MPRKWTQAQKDARSIKGKQYWREHHHPSRGRSHSEETIKKMRKPKVRPPQLGNCTVCGRPLYAAESMKRGMGAFCAGLHDERHSA